MKNIKKIQGCNILPIVGIIGIISLILICFPSVNNGYALDGTVTNGEGDCVYNEDDTSETCCEGDSCIKCDDVNL